MTDTTPYCVVVEHRDGTVQVLGPYLDVESAKRHAQRFADLSFPDVEFDRPAPEAHGSAFLLTAEIDGDDLWIYTQEMTR